MYHRQIVLYTRGRSLWLLAQEERVVAFRSITDAGRAFHHEWVERTFAPYSPSALAKHGGVSWPS